MYPNLIYPCSKSGKILKGFCPTVVDDSTQVAETLFGWIRFADKFNIHYWFNGHEVVKLY